MDLPKAFDWMPHDLLVAKLHGSSKDPITFTYSQLKRRRQGAKINNTKSVLIVLLTGIPQGPTLGPIPFNILTNNLFLFIKEANLGNFANDNTI